MQDAETFFLILFIGIATFLFIVFLWAKSPRIVPWQAVLLVSVGVGGVISVSLDYYLPLMIFSLGFFTVLVVGMFAWIVYLAASPKKRGELWRPVIAITALLPFYLYVVVYPIFLGAEVTIKNPVVINNDREISLEFVFTNNYSSLKFPLPFIKNRKNRWIGRINVQSVFVQSDPPFVSEKNIPSARFLEGGDKLTIRETYGFLQGYEDIDHFILTILFQHGNEPVIIERKRIFSCQRIPGAVVTEREKTFTCEKV